MYECTSAVREFKGFFLKKTNKKISKTYIRVFATFITLNQILLIKKDQQPPIIATLNLSKPSTWCASVRFVIFFRALTYPVVFKLP